MRFLAAATVAASTRGTRAFTAAPGAPCDEEAVAGIAPAVVEDAADGPPAVDVDREAEGAATTRGFLE